MIMDRLRIQRDDSIVEGAMAHGRRDQAVESLEGDVADTGTSPSRGLQSLQWTTPYERRTTFTYAWSTFDTDGETSEVSICDRISR